MIKVGNILINPNDISSIHQDLKPQDPYNNKIRGMQVIQIIYKNKEMYGIITPLDV